MSEYIIEIPDYVPPFDPAARAASLGEEVVRCRDCIKCVAIGVRKDLICTRMSLHAHRTHADGFCAWGERREP